jgi:putative intracellular protease/amidase
VVSNKIITSKGPGTAIQFALTLVEILENSEFANKLANAMITTR